MTFIFSLCFFIITFSFFIPGIANAGPISDAPRIAEVLMNALMTLLKMAGVLAMLSLVFSGVMYFFSAGDEKGVETAKRSAMYSVGGLIVILASLIIVRQISLLFE